MLEFSVHGAPSEYRLCEGALNYLENALLERNFHRVLIIHGEKSWKAIEPFWPDFQKVECIQHQYRGECSLTEINRADELIKLSPIDAIIGIGGGKVLDLVKAVGHISRKPTVLIPTLASNCSSWTPISVIYDDEGSFLRFDIYPDSASLVLVEPRILLAAPKEWLIAGIGDTLAKWYEADVRLAAIENKPVPLEISHFAARKCKDTLINYSEAALDDVKIGRLSNEFIKVVETIIMYAGMVGGYGDEYGRIAGAHSIHNGLTALRQTHQLLHGNKVAYGILVQLIIEEKWEEINHLIPFYQSIGLPVCLEEMGIYLDSQILQVAEKAAAPTESIHAMPQTINQQTVYLAMVKLESQLQAALKLV